MSNLHRRALGGGKTTSKKARSRQPSVPTSQPQSRHGSRHPSRPGSRAGSDDEDMASLSDDTNFSSNSLDEILRAPQEHEEHLPAAWEDDLIHCMAVLGDRNWKRSNVQTREETMTYFCRILSLKYAKETISRRETDLIAGFLKSIRTESSQKEVLLAMKALDLTTITSQPASIYEDAAPAIKRVISEADSVVAKTAAIHTLSLMSFFGNISDDENIDNLNFFLEIVSSDGSFINASDEPAPVTAALEGYALLATLVDDMSSESHDAIEVFVDQLGSSHAAVTIAAGECIALLYEKAYESTGSGSGGEDESSGDSDSDFDTHASATNAAPVRHYDPYRHTAQLESALEKLAHTSSKQMSKKDRKSLHSNFSDILNSVRHSGHGPRYSMAIKDDGSGAAYGSRMVVRISATGVMRIDRWWKLVRLQTLRRVLRDGFVAHYEANPAIFEALPIMLTQARTPLSTGASKMRSKHFAGGTKGLLELPS